MGQSPPAKGLQETLWVSSLSLGGIWREEGFEKETPSRSGFKAQLPSLLAVLFWAYYITSLSL